MPYVDKDPRIDLGELMVSLAYLPSAERLTVVIIKARNLRVVDDTRSSSGNLFLKSFFFFIKNNLIRLIYFRSLRESLSAPRPKTLEEEENWRTQEHGLPCL